MLSFDLGKKEFADLVEGLETSGFVQLLAKTDSACTPLGLYSHLRASGTPGACQYSYLLESVEKEKIHARYSFVGNEPEAVLSIKNKELTLDFPASPERALFERLREGLGKACRLEEEGPRRLRASILPEKDGFDALRSAFPTANGGTLLLNGKRFSRQTFLGGAIGYTAYDSIYECWIDLEEHPESDVPDHQFLIVSKTFLFDHLTEEVYIVLTPFVTPDSDPEVVYEEALSEAGRLYSLLEEAEELDGEGTEVEEKKVEEKVEEKKVGAEGEEKKGDGMKGKKETTENTNPVEKPSNSFPNTASSEEAERKAFEEAVLAAKQHIVDGDIFQVVLSRTRTFQTPESAFELYMRLRTINPSPYMYLFEFGDLSIVGASPETLMTVHERTLRTNPIAGTCPRGKTEAEDEELAARMLGDEKERAEHVMLVDLGRNDVRMVSKSGSVRVSDFMKVLRYSHVQHIESTVFGELRPECDQFDAFKAVFPAGTLSGAPKLRAMEIIANLENSPRGIYGGGAGYYSWNGDADFAIVIRTLLVKAGFAYVQAGAGIVADSNPKSEFLETERKMAAMLSAVGPGVGVKPEPGKEVENAPENEKTPGRENDKMTGKTDPGAGYTVGITPGPVVEENSLKQGRRKSSMKVLFVNNRDSFVWNLVDYISQFEADTVVVPNTITPEEVRKIGPDVLVISPGPGHPAKSGDIGSCIDLIREFGPEIPLLGVCLGHQAINVAFGGTVEKGKYGPVHGKSSKIPYSAPSLFKGLENPFSGGRYHSLEIGILAPNLRVTARTEDGSIMAVEHEEYPIYGLQFHPESVLTPEGLKIIVNFLEAARHFLTRRRGTSSCPGV